MKSFLSEMVAKQPSFSLSGKIRAGIKVPTKAVQENPAAMAVVERVQRGEISFQAAASEIHRRFGIRNPFFPRNTPFFSAHPWDLESGAVAAKKMLDLYGEVRNGDPHPRLYRFPVVFPDIHKGGIDAALGSGLAVRGGGPQTIHYQSRYGDDGVRRCVYLPPIVASKDATRKQFARREFVVRGVCEPDICPQFASGECTFAGTLRFYIPGMPGAGVYAMDTGSTIAASEIYLRLTSLLEECGYLPNFTPDGRPVFWLTKALKPRSHVDPRSGELKKVEQWVPVLETEIDLTKIRMLREQKRTMLSAPTSAPANAGAPAAWMMSPDNDEDEAFESNSCVDADGVILADEVFESRDSPASADSASQEDATAVQQPSESTEDDAGSGGHNAYSDLLAQAQRLGIQSKAQEWAALRFGQDWQADKAGPALESFAAITNRFGPHSSVFLDLQIRLLANDIPVQEVAMPYFKRKFGGIGLGSNLVSILSHVDELLEQGPSVARSHMEANQP